MYPRFTRTVLPRGVITEKMHPNEAYEILRQNEVRDEQILSDVKECIAAGRTPVILSKYKDHSERLYERIKDCADKVFLMTGNNSKKEHNKIREQLHETAPEETLALVATGSLIGEGFDFPRLDTLIMATLVSFRSSVQDLYVTFSGTDDIELGELGAQGLIDAMGESGKIVYISGTPGLSTAEDRTTGFRNIIDQYDGIEIIAEQACDYNRAKAMETMEAILQANSEIDAVWCANDEMAGGVVQAIDAAGRTDEILVGGANLQSDGYQRLLDGTQAWDVTTPPMMLDNALDAILTVLDGGTVEKRINAELDIVTKDNAADFEYQVY